MPVLDARVVLVNVPCTPPIVSVVTVLVELLALDVWRTAIVEFGDIVPDDDVNAPPFTLYSPPLTLIAASTFVPLSVIVWLVITVLNATLDWLGKLNAFGVESFGEGQHSSSETVRAADDVPVKLTECADHDET